MKINVDSIARRVEVDNRIPLRHYYRIADNLLKQASIYREEKNVVDLYIILLRYSSLMSETIPFHQDYQVLLPKERINYKKRLLAVLDELESLKPEFQRRVDELNEGHSGAVLPQLDGVEMVNYWFDEKTVTLSNKNKVSRGKQKEIATSGAQSFAQISNDMAKAKGAPVECANVYLKVYRRRDGTAVTPHAQENINRMESLLSQQGMRIQGELGSGILWSKDDAYAQVFGPERPGRVRGVGIGITPFGRSATNASQFTSTPSLSSTTTQRISKLENNSSRLTEQLAQVQEQLAQLEARHQESEARYQESEARHQQQMAEAMMCMNAMFAQLTGSVLDLSMSQVIGCTMTLGGNSLRDMHFVM